MPTDASYLAEIQMFNLLDETDRVALAAQLDEVSLPAGHMLFKTGDPGDSLMIIRSGEVEVFFKNDTGERIVLETVRAGDAIGELSLLDGGARTASAVVTHDMEGLVLDRGDLEQFLTLRPTAALDLLAAMGRRLRKNAELLRHTASRNVNVEHEDHRTVVQKAADWIAEFSGSIAFLMIHLVIFTIWIVLNVGVIPGIQPFDGFPFGLLTMAVSLEAIILSVFVLLSQNRQVAKDRIRSDVEYDVNLKAELEIAHLHEKFDHLHGEILTRLSAIERLAGRQPANGAEPGTSTKP